MPKSIVRWLRAKNRYSPFRTAKLLSRKHSCKFFCATLFEGKVLFFSILPSKIAATPYEKPTQNLIYRPSLFFFARRSVVPLMASGNVIVISQHDIDHRIYVGDVNYAVTGHVEGIVNKRLICVHDQTNATGFMFNHSTRCGL